MSPARRARGSLPWAFPTASPYEPPHCLSGWFVDVLLRCV
uniref:Uncharacterized protein n=1 Tax=Zea mays TaxID=4577 RepID=B4FH29_MAIZE|nr:unknown [Zea mays]